MEKAIKKSASSTQILNFSKHNLVLCKKEKKEKKHTYDVENLDA